MGFLLVFSSCVFFASFGEEDTGEVVVASCARATADEYRCYVVTADELWETYSYSRERLGLRTPCSVEARTWDTRINKTTVYHGYVGVSKAGETFYEKKGAMGVAARRRAFSAACGAVSNVGLGVDSSGIGDGLFVWLAVVVMVMILMFVPYGLSFRQVSQGRLIVRAQRLVIPSLSKSSAFDGHARLSVDHSPASDTEEASTRVTLVVVGDDDREVEVDWLERLGIEHSEELSQQFLDRLLGWWQAKPQTAYRGAKPSAQRDSGA
ncbi:MAG: hypothetical protein AAGN82_13550 [Myxococcota bacterium]